MNKYPLAYSTYKELSFPNASEAKDFLPMINSCF